jgi:hypothetical protein
MYSNIIESHEVILTIFQPYHQLSSGGYEYSTVHISDWYRTMPLASSSVNNCHTVSIRRQGDIFTEKNFHFCVKCL